MVCIVVLFPCHQKLTDFFTSFSASMALDNLGSSQGIESQAGRAPRQVTQHNRIVTPYSRPNASQTSTPCRPDPPLFRQPSSSGTNISQIASLFNVSANSQELISKLVEVCHIPNVINTNMNLRRSQLTYCTDSSTGDITRRPICGHSILHCSLL